MEHLANLYILDQCRNNIELEECPGILDYIGGIEGYNEWWQNNFCHWRGIYKKEDNNDKTNMDKS